MWKRLPAPSRRRAVWLVNEDVDGQLDEFDAAAGIYMPRGSGGQRVSLVEGSAGVDGRALSGVGAVGDIVLADLSQYVIVSGPPATALSAHIRFDRRPGDMAVRPPRGRQVGVVIASDALQRIRDYALAIRRIGGALSNGFIVAGVRRGDCIPDAMERPPGREGGGEVGGSTTRGGGPSRHESKGKIFERWMTSIFRTGFASCATSTRGRGGFSTSWPR